MDTAEIIPKRSEKCVPTTPNTAARGRECILLPEWGLSCPRPTKNGQRDTLAIMNGASRVEAEAAIFALRSVPIRGHRLALLGP